jgi:hypothetical protein
MKLSLELFTYFVWNIETQIYDTIQHVKGVLLSRVWERNRGAGILATSFPANNEDETMRPTFLALKFFQ